MKKLLTLSLLAAFGVLSLPFNECKAETAPSFTSTLPGERASRDRVGLAYALLDCMGEMNSILLTVVDKDSADAAAVQLVPVINKLKVLSAVGKELGDAPVSDAAEVRSLEPQFRNASNVALKTMIQLAQADFYGSENLRTVLKTMEK